MTLKNLLWLKRKKGRKKGGRQKILHSNSGYTNTRKVLWELSHTEQLSLITTFCFKKNTTMLKNEMQCSHPSPLFPSPFSAGSNEEEIEAHGWWILNALHWRRITGLLPSSFPLLTDNATHVLWTYKTNKIKPWRPFRKWNFLVLKVFHKC